MHRAAGFELGEERGLINAIQGVGRPVQHLRDVQSLQFAGHGELLEEAGDHRHVQVVRRFLPVKWSGVTALMTQHPCREQPIEKRLHERGTKEMEPTFFVKFDAKRSLQTLLHRCQRSCTHTTRKLDAMTSLAGVAGEEGCHVLRVGERRVVCEHAGEEVSERGAVRFLRFVWMRGKRPKVAFRRSQNVALQMYALTVALADQQPVAQVGDEYKFVACPVFVDLRRCRRVVNRIGGRFDFDDAA